MKTCLAVLLTLASVVLADDPVPSLPINPGPPAPSEVPPNQLPKLPPADPWPPGSIADTAAKQWKADSDRWNNYASQYDWLVFRMYASGQEAYTLGRKGWALGRANQDIAKARDALHEADKSINGVGKQLLAVEKAVYFQEDFKTQGIIAGILKLYLDDAAQQLSRAAALLGDADTQIKSVQDKEAARAKTD